MFPFNCFSPLKTLALVEFEGGISGQHSGDIFSLWIKFQTWQKQKQGKKCILLIVSWFNSWTDLQVVPYSDLLERRNPTTVLLHSCICGYIQNYEWTKTFNSSWQLPTSKTGQYGTTQQFIQYQTLLKMSWCWVYAVQLKEQDKLRC